MALRRTDGADDTFAYTGENSIFSGTSDELADVRTYSDAGFGDELDTVFRHSRYGRGIDHFRIDTHLHGFEHITSGKVDCRSHLEGQVNPRLAGRNEGMNNTLYMSSGEVMRLQTIALDIRQAGLMRLDHTVHDLRGRHLTDTHQEELYETDVHTTDCGIDPQHERHVIEENDQPYKDQGHHDDS